MKITSDTVHSIATFMTLLDSSDLLGFLHFCNVSRFLLRQLLGVSQFSYVL